MEKSIERKGFAAFCSLVMAILMSRLQVYADLAPVMPEEPEPFRLWPAVLIAAVVIIALILFFRYRK